MRAQDNFMNKTFVVIDVIISNIQKDWTWLHCMYILISLLFNQYNYVKPYAYITRKANIHTFGWNT